MNIHEIINYHEENIKANRKDSRRFNRNMLAGFWMAMSVIAWAAVQVANDSTQPCTQEVIDGT